MWNTIARKCEEQLTRAPCIGYYLNTDGIKHNRQQTKPSLAKNLFMFAIIIFSKHEKEKGPNIACRGHIR